MRGIGEKRDDSFFDEALFYQSQKYIHWSKFISAKIIIMKLLRIAKKITPLIFMIFGLWTRDCA